MNNCDGKRFRQQQQQNKRDRGYFVSDKNTMGLLILF